MKKFSFFAAAAAVMMFATPAMAQNQAALCKLWFTHKNAQKSANYQPGVDVHGRAVVPADVTAGAAAVAGVADNIRIPVTVELAQLLGAAVPVGTDLQAMAGVVNIHGNGRVTYNGEDLTQGTMTLCTGQVYDSPAQEPIAPASAAGTLGTLPATVHEAEAPRYTPPAVVPHQEVDYDARPADVTLNSQSGAAVHTPEPIREQDIIWGEGQ